MVTANSFGYVTEKLTLACLPFGGWNRDVYELGDFRITRPIKILREV